MRILPDRLGNNQRRGRVDGGENLHAFFLRANEAVLLLGFVRVGADELVAKFRHRGGERLFHGGLRGPAQLVGGGTEIAVGDEKDGIGPGHGQ